MKRLLILLAAALVFTALGVQAARAETTGYPSTLTVGLEARSFGMGGACLAVIGPRFWAVNPAGLPFLERRGILAGRFVDPPPINPVKMSGDQSFLHLSYANPDAGAGAYSLGAYENRYCQIDRYLDYKVLQYAYSYRSSEGIGLGVNLRLVQETDEGTGASQNHLSVDGGALFRLNEAVTAAVLLAEINSAPRVLFGGSVRFGELLLLAVDVERGFTGIEDLLEAIRAGVEVRPIPPIALRAGLYHGRSTMGFGLRLGRPEGLQIDLDFAQYWPEGGDLASPTQTMGMAVYF